MVSVSLKKAPYASWPFFLTVVPNFSNSSGTGCFAAFSTLINLCNVQYMRGLYETPTLKVLTLRIELCRAL